MNLDQEESSTLERLLADPPTIPKWLQESLEDTMPHYRVDIKPLGIHPDDGVAWKLVMAIPNSNGKVDRTIERAGHATTNEDAMRTIVAWISLLERQERRS